MTAARVWFVSELYYPESSATGHYLTGIAEGVAETWDVHVLCSQPTYARRGLRAPKVERHNAVSIRRCGATTFNKDVLLLRLVNVITISMSIAFAAVRRLHRGDMVVAVTNPPLQPFLVAIAARLRGARFILLVHDVYPDVLVAAGLLPPGSRLAAVGRWAARWLYRQATRIVVLGRDMQALVDQALFPHGSRTAIIPNWADLHAVTPCPREGHPVLARLGIERRVVFQYSGNMGRTHDLELLVAAASRLGSRPECHFLFVGWGAKRRHLEEAVRADALANVTVMGPCPDDELGQWLSACDVSMIAFVPGMAGVSVPSRMYNVLAAGKPILAVVDEHSEVALLVKEHAVGWVVRPGDLEGLVLLMERLVDSPGLLAETGRRARAVAERHCTRDAVVASYVTLLAGVQRDETGVGAPGSG